MEIDVEKFQNTFLRWYAEEKRALPWRENHDPYRVWISEIMLQQTQVNTVIPYYLNFMAVFPTIESLANADEAILLKAWEGLGYYSRARNLQKAAKQLFADFDGIWPPQTNKLQELAGIGPYTAGAISSIAFNQDVVAIDGNAFRVFARLLGITNDIAKPATRKIFEQAMIPLLPSGHAREFNQAVMDLGATICTPKQPACLLCPLNTFCSAYAAGTQNELPVKTKKKPAKKVALIALIVEEDGKYLVTKRSSTGLLANMVTFPLYDRLQLEEESKLPMTRDQILVTLATYCQRDQGLNLADIKYLDRPVIIHQFTHLRWEITLVQARITKNPDLSYFNGQWMSASELAAIGLPTVQHKLMHTIGLELE